MGVGEHRNLFVLEVRLGGTTLFHARVCLKSKDGQACQGRSLMLALRDARGLHCVHDEDWRFVVPSNDTPSASTLHYTMYGMYGM